jgi:serine/threonine protein phosphatase 1
VWKRFSWKTERRLPRLPEGLRIYAIGDVHGRVDLLEQALSRIDSDLAEFPVVRPVHLFLGDYIDRGPDSRAVIDRLVMLGRTHEIMCLKGNHDIYPARFLKDPSVLDDWKQCGGLHTLMSYGLAPSTTVGAAAKAALANAFGRILPESHRHFLNTLRPYFSCGDFYFTHAGVRPGVPLAQQREEDLLWIRDHFLLHKGNFTKIIVHGHSPVRLPDVHPNRINIDTGAYASGQLTCLVLEGDGIRFLTIFGSHHYFWPPQIAPQLR